jgi:hypothetical protein
MSDDQIAQPIDEQKQRCDPEPAQLAQYALSRTFAFIAPELAQTSKCRDIFRAAQVAW